MSHRSRALLAATLSVLAAPLIGYAQQAAPVANERVKDLEAKVAALEAQQAAETRDVASTIDSVLRDAEKRSQLLQNSGDMGAGYDQGFFISGGPGWTLRPGAMFQFWNVTNYRDGGDGGGTGGDDDEEIENGFEVHRLELSLEGTAFTKDLQYAFLWDTANDGGGLVLLDAFVRYMFADDWGFRAGQFNDPVHHENLLADGRLLAAERSLVDALIGGAVNVDRTQGVSLIYGGYNANNPLNVEVAFHDGINQDNTNFQKQGDTGSDFGVGGRAEWKAFGMWDAYNDFQAMGNKEDLLVLGIAGDWTQFGDADVYHGTVDAQWENTSGFGLYGAFLVQHFTDTATSTGEDGTNWGGLIQANYLFNPAWEIFGRYSYTEVDDEAGFAIVGDDNISELTVGLNYYLGNNGSAAHRAKVTVDLTYLPDGSPDGQSYKGFLPSEDDEWVIRGQFQFWI